MSEPAAGILSKRFPKTFEATTSRLSLELGSSKSFKSDLNIHTPSTPGHLKITPTMIDDFTINPVLAATTIYKCTLDEFQKVRLKLCWWVPRVMDSSGFSSAKTWNLWMVTNLRCLIFPDHVSATYYQNLGAGQRTYWNYYNAVAGRSPIFRAQIGIRRVLGVDGKFEEEGKAVTKDSSCWTCNYKNASQSIMPAGGFLTDAKGQAGLRINDLNIDEWTKIAAMGGTGIDDQLIGRSTRESFNKHHPLYCNHHLFLATAEDTMHPGHARYQTYYHEAIVKGNPDYALISYSFKHYSNRPFRVTQRGVKTFKEALREDKVLRDMKKNKSKSGYLQEGLGIWSKNGRGWYTPELIDRALKIGAQRGVKVICRKEEDWERASKIASRIHYFIGGDPAKAENKKADDGALSVLRAVPLTERPGPEIRNWQLDYVWAYRVRKADVSEWSAIIHRKQIHFGFTGLMLDPNGGGDWIRPELAKKEQLIRDGRKFVRPIAREEDEATMVNANFSLAMFKRSDAKIQRLWGEMNMRGDDNLYDLAHSEFLEAWQNGIIGLPTPVRKLAPEETAKWSKERYEASQMLDLGATQLTKVCVQTNDDGTTFYSSQQARLFSAKGRKDFAYSMLYAFTRFLCWLKTHEDEEGDQLSGPDADLCG